MWIGRQMDWHVLQSDLAGQNHKSVWCKGENGDMHSFYICVGQRVISHCFFYPVISHLNCSPSPFSHHCLWSYFPYSSSEWSCYSSCLILSSVFSSTSNNVQTLLCPSFHGLSISVTHYIPLFLMLNML